MLIKKLKDIFQDLIDKFLNTYFQRFQKYQPEVMYYFYDTNHDINLNFKIFTNSFFQACNLHL